MKLRFTVTSVIEVEDLKLYEANTIEQAAKNQQAWIDDGIADIMDCMGDMWDVKVEAVKEDGES